MLAVAGLLDLNDQVIWLRLVMNFMEYAAVRIFDFITC